MMDEKEIREMLARALFEAVQALRLPSEAERLEALRRKELLTPPEVEELYGLRVSTLADKRCRGGGPDYIKTGGEKGQVFYRHADLDKWIKSNKRLGSYNGK